MQFRNKTLPLVLLSIIVFAFSFQVLAGDLFYVTKDSFIEKFEAFLTLDSEKNLIDSYSKIEETDNGLTTTKYQGDDWQLVFTVNEQGKITRLTGSIPSTPQHVVYYNAVIFGLSEYDAGTAMFFFATPEAKKAAHINFWVNGYERYMTFSEKNGTSILHFDFRNDRKRSTQFLSPGNHTVGEGFVFAGEYVATASNKTSYIKIYRKRKLIFSSMLNKNADTERILLFDGDVIEILSNTAILKLIME